MRGIFAKRRNWGGGERKGGDKTYCPIFVGPPGEISRSIAPPRTRPLRCIYTLRDVRKYTTLQGIMGHQTRLRRGVQFSNRHSCHHEVGTTRSKSPFSGRISIRARRRSVMKSWSSNKRKFLFLFLPLLLLPVYPRAISNSSRGKFFLDQLLRAEQTLCLFFLSFFFYFSLSNKFTTIVTSRNLSSAKTLIFESRWSLFFCRRGNRTAALEQPRCIIHFKKTQPDGFCIVSSNTISRIFLERTVRKILPLRKLNSAVKRKGKFILPCGSAKT